MSTATEQADRLQDCSEYDFDNLFMPAAAELRRLHRVNAELVAQNEAQKNEWLSWDAKRAALEQDAARYRRIRRGQHWSVIDGIGNTLRGDDLDAAVDAALTSAQSGERK